MEAEKAIMAAKDARTIMSYLVFVLDEHLSQNYDYTVKDQYMGIDLIRNCADVPYVVS